MSALLQKELRILRPSFLIGLAAALSVWALPTERPILTFWTVLKVIAPYLFCPAMVVMLALDSFGREVSSGTFSQLLVQPVPRSRTWWTKIYLLAFAALLIWIIWFVSVMATGQADGSRFSDPERYGLGVGSLLFLFAVFSGGLWTVLLFRQVGVAFWFTILVPLSICVGTALLLGDAPEKKVNTVMALLFVLYGFSGIFFARWLFFRAQDLKWSGGIIAIPKLLSVSKAQRGQGSQRRFGPRMAMWRREFQLHHSQLIIAAFLAAFHLVAIAARNFGNGFKGHEYFESLFHIFWLLWLVLPVLIGCGAIAEERKLGTLEGQLCLPETRRAQFVTKLAVVIVLSVVFGAFMPTVLEHLDGTRFFSNAQDMTGGLAPNFRHIILWYWILFVPIALVSSLISFYFSSLSVNTLQAMGPAILAILVAGFALGFSLLPEILVGYPLWRGFIGDLIALPVLGCVGLWLAYSNYRNVQRGWLVWIRNIGGIVAALTFSVGTATALYHRAWEVFLPLEAQPGPARITDSSRVTLASQPGSITVTLPDGQVWVGNFGYSISSFTEILTGNWKLAELSGGHRFLERSNWTSLSDCISDTVGIQKDGSLWISRKPLPVEFVRIYSQKKISSPEAPEPFRQYGEDHDWQRVATYGQFALLLKQNGTLWTFSNLAQQQLATHGHWQTDWPGLSVFKLVQVGSDSDWAELRNLSPQKIYIRKSDGRVWSNIYHRERTNNISLQNDVLTRQPFLDGHDWRSLTVVDRTIGWGQPPGGSVYTSFVGVRDDASLVAMAVFHEANDSKPTSSNTQLAPGTNWVSVADFYGPELVALKSDGTLWKWKLPSEEDADNQAPVRMGARSDWVALSGSGANVLALSADGTIWNRNARPPWDWSANELLIPSLISVSTRPQFVANIFGAGP